MDFTTSATRLSARKVFRWTLQILVGLAFIAAAAAKIFSAPPMVEVFDRIGFGQWFRYVVAVIELTGGILLILPRRALFGALILSITMLGALLTHALIIGGQWQPAAGLFVLSLLLVWLNALKQEGEK
ncbi:DoxX family protein [Pantoea sp. GM01]|uniref:DoxX family protein n=1 Tax=Pantoea sp. GM01 TaxID=1144320 RepID=UPI000270F7EE|nr:DoxX family protein [Pantoea sp. GM01]EJL93210.1 DoxX protein [Pantoea sp. GM01]